MFRIGEVVGFRSAEVGKHKFHLCVSHEGHFLFLNSPKPKSFMGDFEIEASQITGVPVHPSGKTIISCTMVMRLDARELSKVGAKRCGQVDASVLRDLFLFVEQLSTLSPETRDAILDGLGDWV